MLFAVYCTHHTTSYPLFTYSLERTSFPFDKLEFQLSAEWATHRPIIKKRLQHLCCYQCLNSFENKIKLLVSVCHRIQAKRLSCVAQVIWTILFFFSLLYYCLFIVFPSHFGSIILPNKMKTWKMATFWIFAIRNFVERAFTMDITSVLSSLFLHWCSISFFGLFFLCHFHILRVCFGSGLSLKSTVERNEMKNKRLKW